MRLDYLIVVDNINKKLAHLYGPETNTGKPLYRLVYSDDQIEKRRGDFNVYVDGTDCLLRTEKNVIREVPKYGHLHDQFIVEKLLPNPHQDVMGEDYTYECFYAFKEGLLPPIRAIVFLINSQQLIAGLAPKTEKEAIDRDNTRIKLEKVKTREILDTRLDYTDISLRLKHGAAVTDFNQKVGFENE